VTRRLRFPSREYAKSLPSIPSRRGEIFPARTQPGRKALVSVFYRSTGEFAFGGKSSEAALRGRRTKKTNPTAQKIREKQDFADASIPPQLHFDEAMFLATTNPILPGNNAPPAAPERPIFSTRSRFPLSDTGFP